MAQKRLRNCVYTLLAPFLQEEPIHFCFPIVREPVIRGILFEQGFEELSTLRLQESYVPGRRWGMAKVFDRMQLHVRCFSQRNPHTIGLNAHWEPVRFDPIRHLLEDVCWETGKKKLRKYLVMKGLIHQQGQANVYENSPSTL